MSTTHMITQELPGDITTFDKLLVKLEKGMHVLVYWANRWEYAKVQTVRIRTGDPTDTYVSFSNEITSEGVHSMLTLDKYSHLEKFKGWKWRVRVLPDDEVVGRQFSYPFFS